MKKKKKPNPDDSTESSDEKAIRFLGLTTAAYVFEATGYMPSDEMARFEEWAGVGSPDWRESLEQIYGINPTFVRSVYALGSERWEPLDSIRFILRGLGCPNSEECLREIANDFCD